jgi:radical SAM superfamily enzyme YgiQ (UPF0313 family)
MKVKMILPALIEARTNYSRYYSFHPIKYSLFPPLGLTTLAGYLDFTDEVEVQDEHVETLTLNDSPDLVVIQVYTTNAFRAYEIADGYRARGSYVCLGGLHVTAMPEEAASHADSIFLGPGEDTWPRFLSDFRQGQPQSIYRSVVRCLDEAPPVRRDLIKRHKYLFPNTIVVSRGCPHQCEFCYKESFFKGGSSFYTMPVERALRDIESMPGKHLFFLDDHLFGNPVFARSLFDGLKGMGKVWQAAGTTESIQRADLLDSAVEAGLRGLFVGFKTLSDANLTSIGKFHSIRKNYEHAIKMLHDRGVMVNGSFVFGLENDDLSVFNRTAEWAIECGLETATFHILTPYPGTRLYDRLKRQGRILTNDWSLYDTRHAVFKPDRMDAVELEAGYRQAYRDFYSWKGIFRSAQAQAKEDVVGMVRHLAYTGGWKKCDPVWSMLIKAGQLNPMNKIFEAVLGGFGQPKTRPQVMERIPTPAVLKRRTLPAEVKI